MKIAYCTTNQGKFREACLILEGWELEQTSIDFPEIQGEAQAIVRQKALDACAILKRPLIVEDVGIYCPALNGLPGPYVKDFLIHIGAKGFSELIHRYSDHRVEAVCLAAYVAPGEEPKVFEGRVKGHIVAPKGTTHHGKHSFNTIFLPEGYTRTSGELDFEEHAIMSPRSKALRALKQELEGKK
jgi:inosine triphosphate pyrophosphatase